MQDLYINNLLVVLRLEYCSTTGQENLAVVRAWSIVLIQFVLKPSETLNLFCIAALYTDTYMLTSMGEIPEQEITLQLESEDTILEISFCEA
jgi:hypothetical protein